MRVVCDRCNGEISLPGGLAFSPPSPGGRVKKIHLCVDCWMRFMQWMVSDAG